MPLIKNGKFFQPPLGGEEDFKELFARVAAAGVGRPVDRDGFPQGPWTPDLLASAISQIDTNRDGIELRTVQLWFETNDKGISTNNIRWLARILGCNDPEAASAWQTELSAAQSRLVSKRREARRREVEPQAQTEVVAHSSPMAEPTLNGRPRNRFSLARISEDAFSGQSFLNLPAFVFAGAVALQFVSYFLGIHNISYRDEAGILKQVGFLWAPNWTFLFILFMPLFLALVVEQVAAWKKDARASLLSDRGAAGRIDGWRRKVEASSLTFGSVFVICLGFAGIFQWINVRLIPVITGESDYAVDWGSLALARPDEIGIVPQVVFTGAAYLYMSVCFYLFVSGLILLTTLVSDYSELSARLRVEQDSGRSHLAEIIGALIMRSVFRCTVTGLLIAMCMKLESLYIVVSAPNIWAWLVADLGTIGVNIGQPVDWGAYRIPTHYTSLLIALLVCVVFVYSVLKVGLRLSSDFPLVRMISAVFFLTLVYLLVGVVTGFSALLCLGVLVSVYGLFDPEFGKSKMLSRGRIHVL